MPLLSVRNLQTRFATDRGTVRAVDGVSFDLEEGEVLGLVGESGSGKSVTALSIMRLVPEPPGHVIADALSFDGTDLLRLSEAQAREVRGAAMAMIFQDPMRSLNPVLTIGRQITEVLRRHQRLDLAGGTTARHRVAGDRRHPSRRTAPHGLSAPILRRHAPEGDDRHRAVVQSPTAHRRRGDDGARRHHPGADHRPGEAPDARARHGRDLDQPRPRRDRRPVRPGERDVRRAKSWNRARSGSCSIAPATATRSASWGRHRASTAARGG